MNPDQDNPEERIEDKFNVVDVADFNSAWLAYSNGRRKGLDADVGATARDPRGTGAFAISVTSRPIPRCSWSNCVGCTVASRNAGHAIGKVAIRHAHRSARSFPRGCATEAANGRTNTHRHGEKGLGGGKFGIFIDPTKCKGCAECERLRRP
jgi:hypothetical protein